MNIVSFRKKIVLACVCMVGMLAIAATDSLWSEGAPNGGDVTDPANWTQGENTFWQDSYSKETHYVAYFLPRRGPDGYPGVMNFTASKDMTYATFRFHPERGPYYPATEYILDIGKDRTMYFKGSADASIWVGGNNGTNGIVRFKSGTYKVADNPAAGCNTSFRMTPLYGGMTAIIEGSDTLINMGLNFNGYSGTLLCITNGACFRAQGSLRIDGSNNYGSNYILKDGVILVSGKDPVTGKPSMFDGNNIRVYAFDNDNNGGEMSFIVNDGAIITNFFGNWGNRGSNAKMIIDNAFYYGSTTEHLTLGCTVTGSDESPTSWPTNNSVTVCNNGEFYMPQSKRLIIGSKGCENSFTAKTGAKVDVDGIYIGVSDSNKYIHNYTNKLSVLSGAKMNIHHGLNVFADYSVIDIAGEGTLVDICNPNGYKGNTGNEGIRFYSTNLIARIRDGAIVTNYSTGVGILMNFNPRLEVIQNGTIYLSSSFIQGYNVADSNSFTLVESGGKIIVKDHTFQLGHNLMVDGTDWNNTCWVGTDGLIDTKHFRVCGYGNNVIISNGTIRASDEFRSTMSDDPEYGGRTKIVFAGTKPKVLVYDGGHVDFYREGTIRFEIPEEGYETIPFEQLIGDTNIRGGTKMEFEFEDYARAGGGTLTLMKGLKFNIPNDQWESIQANLPPDCSLFFNEDRTELQIKVKNKKPGLSVFIK